MAPKAPDTPDGEDVEQSIPEALVLHISHGRRRRFGRFLLASLSSIPWVGGFLSAMVNRDAEAEQGERNLLHERWFEEHSRKIMELGATLAEIMDVVEGLGVDVEERLESESYLALVRRGFNVWDDAATQEKRDLVKQLLSRAAGSSLTSDDLVRLFLDWIDKFHEAHFSVIRAVYQNPGITRAGIWRQIHGEIQRDDSAEADLFALLILDLSTGHVIRQHRRVTANGQYLKEPRHRSTGRTRKSPFDDIEPYELTQLGNQFVHYTMHDIVPSIGEPNEESQG